ncbi:MAG: ATP-binding protein [Thermoplasmatota archaeon]
MVIPPGAAEPLRRGVHPGVLDAILEASREAIVCLDAGGSVTAWSRGAELAYGYLPHEAIGRRLEEFLVPEEGEEEQVRLALLAGGQAPRFESVRRRKDGSRAEVSVAMQALHDAAGKVTGFCLVEREAGEGGLAEEVARLQERDRLRTEFLSESAHELNTPLTPVRLQLQLLKLMKDLTPQERANIDALERNILRLGGLVQDMLDAARLQSGRFRLERSRLDLGRLVEETADAFRVQAHQEGLRLECHADPLLMVHADPNRATQVMFNLLSNAVKFNRRGGAVEVGARREGDQALVWVRDTGIGLTQDQVGRLFRPFGRLHEEVAGIPKGTGLGLYISKGIVESHGGRIWAESEGPGKGSTWWVTLPLDEPGEPAAPMDGPQTSF